jgi:ribosomal protein S24E
MEHKIIQQKKNPYMGREEMELVVTSENNPTKQQILEILGKKEELVVIQSIVGNFGHNEFDVKVLVYDNAESMKKVEIITRKVRKKAVAEAKKAALDARAAAQGGAK